MARKVSRGTSRDSGRRVRSLTIREEEARKKLNNLEARRKIVELQTELRRIKR